MLPWYNFAVNFKEQLISEKEEQAHGAEIKCEKE